MAISANSRTVFDYVKAHNGEFLTSGIVAEATGLAKKTVDGCFTALQRKGYGVRTAAEIENDDGTHTPVKVLSLTPDGMKFDPDAATED